MADLFELKTTDLKGIKKKNLDRHVENKTTEVDIDTIVTELGNKGENSGGYNESLWDMVANCKPHYKIEFYIEVIPYIDETFNNLYQPKIHTKMYSRMSCPTPALGHRVYHYRYIDDTLEELWVLPDHETAKEMVDFPIESRIDAPVLFGYFMDYRDKTLLKQCKKLNKETDEDGRFLVLNDPLDSTVS